MLVVIWILDLLAAIAQIPEYAHTILDDLVADVRLLDGGAHDVEEGVDEAVALAQLLTGVLAGTGYIAQHARGVAEDGRPAGLAVRGARVPARVRNYYVVHHHRHAVVDDGFLQVLRMENIGFCLE